MSVKSVSEVDIWEGILTSESSAISVAEANLVLRWRLPEQSAARMEKLAQLNGQGELSEAEREELEAYVNVGQVIGILQAKARLALKQTRPTGQP